MNQESKIAVPVWYWIVAGVALLWNLMGCAFFFMELFAQDAMMESMSEEQKEWVRSIPAWVYVVYGLAVSSGVAGCVALLMRQGWAIYAFAVCLVSVIIQMFYSMIIAGGLDAMGPSGLVMPMMVILIAAVLVWFSWHALKRQWLGQVAESAKSS